MSSYESMSESQQFACRVIADHARSTAFAIADGILPGNEGRNYVLRKIMRRAIYHGREHLGLTEPFFYKVCDFVVDKMHGAFPELETQREFIGKMVRLEEERFGSALTVGLKKLLEHIAENKDAMLKGDFDFDGLAKLYDTYGVPKDLIRVALEDRGFVFSEDEFIDHIDKAHTALQSGNTYKLKGGKGSYTMHAGAGNYKLTGGNIDLRVTRNIYSEMLKKVGPNKFLGYETLQIADAKVVAILDGETQIDRLAEGAQGSIILNETPFYAESGGQVGDTGTLTGALTENHRVGETPPPLLCKEGSLRANVNDTFSPVAGLIIHKVTVDKGAIKVGDTVTATVDVQKRDATRRNHTATHLVHAALKEVLGTHVKQAGSVVAPNYLRFDFTHYQPMTDGEIAEIEDLVNRYILQNEPVTTDMMKLEDAMRSGAVAMFGEKYGGEVRVLSVGDGAFSKELCGGTHVRATGDIGSFKITSDEAIASGVRRIRAITGLDAFERFRDDEKLIDASLGALNTQRDNLPNAIARLQEELKKTRKEMDDLKLKIALGGGQGSVAGGQSSTEEEAREINGVKVLGKIVDGLDAHGTRQLSDTLLARLKSGVVIIGRSEEGKVGIIVRVSDDLTAKVKAGDIIREIAPIVGGRGGGKPDMAEGGGTDPSKLSEAIDASYGVIEKMVSEPPA